MKKLSNFFEKIWAWFSVHAQSPFFIFIFPLVTFLTLTVFERSDIAFIALLLWGATIIANTNESK